MSGKQAREERNKPGECIFCGQSGNLSKQHIWPKWLKDIYARLNESHFFERNGIKLANRIVSPYHEKRKLNGHQGTAKVRKLCKTCNNGWVSAIENNMKPTFTALLLGESISLKSQQQKLLTDWAIISTIVNELALEANNSIPESDRHYLYENRSPSPNWMVWIARNEGIEWKLQQIRNRKLALPDHLVDYGNGKGRRYEKLNAQLTAFGIGSLLIITCRTPWPEFQFQFNFPPGQKLVRLWPTEQTSIDWIECLPMNDTEINSLFDYFKAELTLGQLF